ncbi:hypothetical protein NH340_JMT04573 [Sarcoptes scabiei]|nr:hypothetical protein NH340_JMT04573 [Sarcoptes scabiei]
MTDATYDYTNPPLKLNQPPNLVSGRKKLKKLIQSILILALAMITISFNLSHKPESKPKFSTAQFFLAVRFAFRCAINQIKVFGLSNRIECIVDKRSKQQKKNDFKLFER